MAQTNPNVIFGVHGVTFYNRADRSFFGTLRVLKGSTFSLTGENVLLNGGSSPYPWDVQTGLITSELAITFSDYQPFLSELFLGKDSTTTTAETTGDVSTPENASGTSIIDATTGIASIGAKAGSEADLKFTKYVVQYVSATTVDIYAATDVDFARGTNASFVDDTLKITATPLTVPDAGATVDVPNFGLEITGGSGTVAFTSGDSAFFEVRPINAKSTIVSVGATSDTFPEFGALIYAEANNRLFEIDAFRCKASGMPFGFNPKEHSEAEVTANAFQDLARGGVFSYRDITLTA